MQGYYQSTVDYKESQEIISDNLIIHHTILNCLYSSDKNTYLVECMGLTNSNGYKLFTKRIKIIKKIEHDDFIYHIRESETALVYGIRNPSKKNFVRPLVTNSTHIWQWVNTFPEDADIMYKYIDNGYDALQLAKLAPHLKDELVSKINHSWLVIQWVQIWPDDRFKLRHLISSEDYPMWNTMFSTEPFMIQSNEKMLDKVIKFFKWRG